MSYADALAEAQRLGYAEADPTLDVDGSDAAHKLAVLAQIAFGVAAKPHEIERKGIDTLDAMDIRFANELGYTIKLLAEAWTRRHAQRRAARRRRCCCGTRDLLAQVRGAYNAIAVVRRRRRRDAVPGAGGGADADGEFGRRRSDRPGGRPGAADVRRGAALVEGEQGLHRRADRARAQPLLSAAARRATSPACWPT